jgi:hypothetical protein
MPISADEFSKVSSGPNEIEKLLRANPDKAYSLSELEEAIIGKEMNRKKHLDVFIGNLILLAPVIFELELIQCRIIDGVVYLRWAE